MNLYFQPFGEVLRKMKELPMGTLGLDQLHRVVQVSEP